MLDRFLIFFMFEVESIYSFPSTCSYAIAWFSSNHFFSASL